jgi:hypothetical protein
VMEDEDMGEEGGTYWWKIDRGGAREELEDVVERRGRTGGSSEEYHGLENRWKPLGIRTGLKDSRDGKEGNRGGRRRDGGKSDWKRCE